MKHIKYLFIIFFCFTIILSCSSGTSKAMQDDFDKYRINDILYFYDLVEQYHVKTGHYPLEKEADEPTVVIFQSGGQEKAHDGNFPIFVDLGTRGDDIEQPQSINILDAELFYQELSSVLGSDITKRFDPQKVPVKKPCLYQYTVYLNEFDVSCFLHNRLEFTRELSEYNNRLAISSSPESFPDLGVWSKAALFSNVVFIDFLNQKINKPGYHEKLIKKQSGN